MGCFCRVAAVLFLTSPLLAQTGPAEPAVAASTAAAATATVLIGNKPVLVVRERMLSLSAEERAARISERIRAIARDPLARIPDIRPVENSGMTDIALDDLVIMSVTEQDAVAAGMGRPELARIFTGAIQAAILGDRHTGGFRTWLAKAAIAVLCTIGLLLGWRMLHLLRLKHAPSAEAWIRGRAPGLSVQHLELISSSRVADLLTRAFTAAAVAPNLLLVWLYSVIIFGIFPFTKGLSWWLIDHVTGPLRSVAVGVAGSIPDLLFVGVVAACTHYALRMAHLLFLEIRDERLSFPGFYPEWAIPTFQIVRFLAWAFALVVAFPYLPGSSSPAFRGVSVFLGLLLSLGSSSAVANVVAGVILTYMRPFKLGDRVRVGDNVGDVIEKTLLVTRLRTIKNVEVTIPNAVALSAHIDNFSSCAERPGLILNTTVTIGYDAPWSRVHELLTAAARETDGIKAEPAPFVLQTQLGDYSVSYELNAYTADAAAMARTYSRLHEKIQDKFNEAGVEIMSPRFMSLRDGNQTTLPEHALSKSYIPPAFRVRIEGQP